MGSVKPTKNRKILVAMKPSLARSGVVKIIDSWFPSVSVTVSNPSISDGELPHFERFAACILDSDSADYLLTMWEGRCPPIRYLLVSPRLHVGLSNLPGLPCACGHAGLSSAEDEFVRALAQLFSCSYSSRGACGEQVCPLKPTLKPVLPKLTAREIEVLDLIGTGLSPKDIALKCGISVKTVESYRGQIRAKLGFSDTRALLDYAFSWRRGGTC